MAGWKKQWRIFTSFVLCAAAVVLGILLYPLILLLFSCIALVHPARRRETATPRIGREDGREEG